MEISSPAPVVHAAPALAGGEIGLTEADFSIQFVPHVELYPQGQGACVAIKSIEFFIGYKSLKILVLARHKPGSCEYGVVVEHEMQHVEAYRRVLARYGRLFEEELRIAALSLSQSAIYSPRGRAADADKAIDELVRGNPRILALKSRMEAEIAAENSAIDTQEEYRRVRALCRNW
ncbi:MAG: hypothetical protein LBL52_03195 [Rickettsiales bacterium]|nr:hypothetical protein [Rickettsiales bacterium]